MLRLREAEGCGLKECDSLLRLNSALAAQLRYVEDALKLARFGGIVGARMGYGYQVPDYCSGERPFQHRRYGEGGCRDSMAA